MHFTRKPAGLRAVLQRIRGIQPRPMQLEGLAQVRTCALWSFCTSQVSSFTCLPKSFFLLGRPLAFSRKDGNHLYLRGLRALLTLMRHFPFGRQPAWRFFPRPKAFTLGAFHCGLFFHLRARFLSRVRLLLLAASRPLPS